MMRHCIKIEIEEIKYKVTEVEAHFSAFLSKLISAEMHSRGLVKTLLIQESQPILCKTLLNSSY